MDIVRLRRPGPVHAGRRRASQRQSRRRPQRGRPSGRARAGSCRVGTGSPLRRPVGLAHAAARRRPGDRHQLPVVLRPPRAQGGVAVPPAPRRVRRGSTRRGPTSDPTTQSLETQRLLIDWDTQALAEATQVLHHLGRRRRPRWPATTASTATPLYHPPPLHDRLHRRRLRRLRLLPQPAGAATSVRCWPSKGWRTSKAATRLVLAGTGSLHGERRRNGVATRGVRPARPARLRRRRRPDRALRRCPRGDLRALRRGLRLRHAAGLPRRQAGHHRQPTRAACSSGSRTA